MDSHDIFKKLTRGAKFNTKKIVPFQNIQQAVSDTNGNTEGSQDTNGGSSSMNNRAASMNDDAESASDMELVKESDDEQEEECEMTLLGDIKASQSGKKSKRKKKQKEHSEEKKRMLEQEKLNHFRNQNNITVVGRHVAAPLKDFDELHSEFPVKKELVEMVKKCGYDTPTPIQMQAIPIMLGGRQVLACAPTGSGKTAAFLVPIIHHLGGPQRKGFRAVVLCPTRELAKQTLRECDRLSEGTGLRAFIIHKVNQAFEKYGPKSSMKFDILITTPNRLCFLLNQENPAISLTNVQWLVIDEADKLFETGVRGFREQLTQITTACSNSEKKIAMFSATCTPAVSKWSRKNLRGLICVTIGRRNTATDLVDQQLLFVGNESGKLIAFRDLIRKGLKPPVLVFVQSKERAQELFTELIYDGINVDVIHADRTQTQRDNVVRSFREGRIWVLICTELMGRGVDFLGVNLVVNYDFPTSAISYIHRIGRTGRAGHKGKAITFFTKDDVVNLRSIAQVLRSSGCEVPEYMLALKKTGKKNKKKLASSAPKRDVITTIPNYQLKKEEKKRKHIKRSLVDKKEGKDSEEQPKAKKQKMNVELSTSKVEQNKKKKKYSNNKSTPQKNGSSR